ncbi:gluconeogenesis factor YvcK family protein [Anaeromyxobacter terrae]|uniref:gluconeogenesis factor YvcK family protein n=1 Tax=Anaeromyxobacter terrae TaxID=2925406 RepID=UPI001F56DFD5|nr:gluconeogenesis factor YvcK family protein [Anaeromyxobacter sp. SG22]
MVLEELVPRPLRAADARPIRIAAVGGGTGLPRVLEGLAAEDDPEDEERSVDLTAVVTTADDGGSSGELRRRYGVPAPGDVRNCLVALAAGAPLAAVFQHRFDGGGELAGHTIGNLVLTALAQRLGDFGQAVDAAAGMLGVRGRVVPATATPVELVAELDDGRVVRGETAIAAAHGRVATLRLTGAARASPEAIEAIHAADLVVLGPGSLYSSVLAGLLVPGIAEALRTTGATRVLVVNLFTQAGETDGLDAADHVRAVQRHLGDVVDVALAQRPPLPAETVAAYSGEGAEPVRVDRAAIDAAGAVPVVTDLLAAGERGRHDPRKLARALLAIARVR